ncbi:hypothetical protein T484DRAFT_1832578 [Baffinella frigidus]|nr:hypothetical protein T484DRAFT_1832578 [Cryptophyta sp. CCMP2293]
MIFSTAMMNVARALVASGLDAHCECCLQIHDELLFEVDDAYLPSPLIHDELLFEVDEAYLPEALALIDHAMTTIDSRLKVWG